MDADHQPLRPDPESDRSGPTSQGRRWLLRGMTVALSLAPFLCLEIVLRVLTPPAAADVDFDPAVDLQQLRPLFVLNESEGRWEIPATRFNFFQPDSFLADKPAGSRRIFVLGGSTVQGRPYSIETSFAKWLSLRLQASSPVTKFEVINCGGVSYASYRVAKVLHEVLDHDPDAIVLYTGHNEFLEDREYAHVRDLSRIRRWLARVASNLRTVSWIRSKLNQSSSKRSSMAAEVDARLDHVGGLDRYHRDPSWRRGVEEHFSETLQRMVASTRRAGVPLVLCVPASDLVNTPPFKVEEKRWEDPSPQSATFQNAWRKARDSNADVRDRLSACERCLSIDPEHAGANYIAGRLHYDRGDTRQALPFLTAARDYDVCPLRATSPIVQTVITVADDYRIPHVNTVVLLDQRDSDGRRIPDGLPDPEFFVDHLHPTVAGHQELGAAIAAEIETLGWFETALDAEKTYQALAEMHLASLGEEYYARGRQRLEGLRRWAAGRAGKLAPDMPANNAVD